MNGEHGRRQRWGRRAVSRVEDIVEPGVRAVEHIGEAVSDNVVEPAWRRVTQGEPRWPVSIGVLVAIALLIALPARVAMRPGWLLPTAAFIALLVLVFANPGRIELSSRWLRRLSVTLIATVTVANLVSVGRLVERLVHGKEEDASALLLIGAAIWLTNVIVFSLWYWEFDRGGPVSRAQGLRRYVDFLFPQMDATDVSPPDWEPGYVDYLYLSFTNATAFSPTDVLPLARWTKLTMLVQSSVSLMTVALVISRAVNILK